jgi:hypothetical protein
VCLAALRVVGPRRLHRAQCFPLRPALQSENAPGLRSVQRPPRENKENCPGGSEHP